MFTSELIQIIRLCVITQVQISISTAKNIWEYGFTLTLILPYKDRFGDSVLIRENTDSENRILAYCMQCSGKQSNLLSSI